MIELSSFSHPLEILHQGYFLSFLQRWDLRVFYVILHWLISVMHFLIVMPYKDPWKVQLCRILGKSRWTKLGDKENGENSHPTWMMIYPFNFNARFSSHNSFLPFSIFFSSLPKGGVCVGRGDPRFQRHPPTGHAAFATASYWLATVWQRARTNIKKSLAIHSARGGGVSCALIGMIFGVLQRKKMKKYWLLAFKFRVRKQ